MRKAGAGEVSERCLGVFRHKLLTPIRRYPYLTHLIHNAGGGAFTGLDFLSATWMMVTSFRAAVTFPKYKLQRSGDVSQDGLGWVWQINVGSSWALVSGVNAV